MRLSLKVMLTFLALIFSSLPIHARADHGNRIVVIGDLHGDFEAYRDIVSAAGLSSREGRWSGGRATLVQMGDIVDRGPDSLAIIRDLRELARQASRHGGQVIILIGNHEAMNVIGDLRYVDEGEYAAFRDQNSRFRRKRVYEANRKAIEAFYAAADPPLDATQAQALWLADFPLGKVEHRLAWSPKGDIGSWVGQLPATVLIDGTLFVHGGLSAEFAVHSLDDINQMVQKEIMLAGRSPSSVLEDPIGPLWYRGNIFRHKAAAEVLGIAVEEEGAIDQALCENPCRHFAQGVGPEATFGESPCLPNGETPALDESACETTRPSIEEELDLVLSTYGADRMIVAHTPSLEGIVSMADGRLIRADTGISAFYGGPRSYLELQGDQTIAWQRWKGSEWESRKLPQPGQRNGN